MTVVVGVVVDRDGDGDETQKTTPRIADDHVAVAVNDYADHDGAAYWHCN